MVVGFGVSAMKRREFITMLGGAAAWPLAARAQQTAGNIPKIGLLWPGASAPASPRMESFRRGLREQGYVDGRNVIIELRYAREGPQHLADLAADLVRMNVDVIWTAGDLAPKIAQQATRTIPIVATTDDILGAGLVTSLSQPGGNITGLTILAPELSAKRLELLKNIVPGLTRVAALWDPTTGTSQVTATDNAAQFLNLDLNIFEVRHRDDLARAFEAARKKGAEALNVFSSPFLSSLSGEIIGLAAENRLPAIYQWREHAEAGGLISYGPNLAEMWRQSALIVTKILGGAKPSDLPVEQSAKFELVINQKTADALGLELPLPLLIRADEVIQ
jgi:putative tryptophan/tyrosine transport system substrate-binding protein